ncbi:MAG: helix-turn-helix transcriptional regulator [Gammaproteobacteria bacterium]|nr:helix-turn-helix transcriptional regulator [Gammaproteobacteria bacterium]
MILTNSIADKITNANTILNIRGETLYVADPVQQRTLNTLIESAIYDEQSGYQPNESVTAFRGRNGSALTVFISPFRYFQNHSGVLSSNGGVCLLLSDPDRVQEVSEAALKKIYKLTASEVKVALLVANGLSVSDISRVRNVSENTVRAQLKAIMRKVGVSSQCNS